MRGYSAERILRNVVECVLTPHGSGGLSQSELSESGGPVPSVQFTDDTMFKELYIPVGRRSRLRIAATVKITEDGASIIAEGTEGDRERFRLRKHFGSSVIAGEVDRTSTEWMQALENAANINIGREMRMTFLKIYDTITDRIVEQCASRLLDGNNLEDESMLKYFEAYFNFSTLAEHVGDRLLKGEHVRSVLDSVLPRIREVVPELPREVGDLVEKCVSWLEDTAKKYPEIKKDGNNE